MSRKTGKSFLVQPPDLDAYTGQPLRRFLTDLSRWLRQFAAKSAEPGSRRDRYWAVTSGTITANAGINGPLGHGNVVRRQRRDDRTLFDIGDGEEIEVDNAVYVPILSGSLVLIEIVDGVDTITALVDCP